MLLQALGGTARVARVAGVRVGVGGAREAEQPGGEAAQVVEEEEDVMTQGA